MNSEQNRSGIYRGVVVYNLDPENRGRVKVYVYGVYPIQFKNKHTLLPWAQPAMSIWGGGWKNQLSDYVQKEQSFGPKDLQAAKKPKQQEEQEESEEQEDTDEQDEDSEIKDAQIEEQEQQEQQEEQQQEKDNIGHIIGKDPNEQSLMATTNPASWFDPIKIGQAVLSGANTQDQIKIILQKDQTNENDEEQQQEQQYSEQQSSNNKKIIDYDGDGIPDEQNDEKQDEKQGGNGKGNGSGGGPNKIKQLNSQTGYCCVPQAGYAATDGMQVYVFFEANDINKPVYFAVAQSGKGWFSQHHNQYVYMTNNMRVRVDEETKRDQSTVKFDTYNTNCVKDIVLPQPIWIPKPPDFTELPNVHLDKIPSAHTTVNHRTKIDLQILAADDQQTAVDLKVTGRVNLKVVGDLYLQHIGNKYQTHVGNTFEHHIGNTYIERQGDISIATSGNIYTHRIGNMQHTLVGNRRKHHTGNEHHYQIGDMKEYIYVVKTIYNSIKSTDIDNLIINDNNIINTITNTNNIINTVTNNNDIINTVTNNNDIVTTITNTNNIINTVTNNNDLINTISNANTFVITIKNGSGMTTTIEEGASITNNFNSSAPFNTTISAPVYNKTINAPIWNITSKVVKWILDKLDFI